MVVEEMAGFGFTSGWVRLKRPAPQGSPRTGCEQISRVSPRNMMHVHVAFCANMQFADFLIGLNPFEI
jgi:hypothetical protein